MPNSPEKTLYRTAAVIFEELSFLLPSPANQPIGDAPALGAAVVFRGPFSGMLLVRVTRNIVPILSANMLGEDGAHDERMECDAVGEIANVICGNALPAIAGVDEPFHLQAPRHFEGALPAEMPPDLARRATVCLGLDDGKAEIAMYVTENSLP